jgi:hypothetical protein
VKNPNPKAQSPKKPKGTKGAKATKATEGTLENRFELTAIELFRIVHGPGDTGGEFQFHCQNPALAEGWYRLARYVAKLENAAAGQ